MEVLRKAEWKSKEEETRPGKRTARCRVLAGRLSKENVVDVDDQRAVGTSRSRTGS
jgi:hypothetical protein